MNSVRIINLQQLVVMLVATVLVGATLAARADDLETVKSRGVLRVAVYSDFEPFSDNGKGIDVELAQALAAKLGVKADVVAFDAGENMADDFRNMVWKGHYLGYPVAHVLLHVPVDTVLMDKNPQVQIFAPYYNEQIAVLRNLTQVPVFLGLEAFTRIKIGVEGDSLPHQYLVGSMGGRFADSVVQFKTVHQAVDALKAGSLGAVMASRAQMEAAAGVIPKTLALTQFTGVGLSVREWDLGLAVKKENTELAKVLEEAMQSLKVDGTLQKLFVKYSVSYQAPTLARSK
jgi:polar amino acid transport system substrate-binding protein